MARPSSSGYCSAPTSCSRASGPGRWSASGWGTARSGRGTLDSSTPPCPASARTAPTPGAPPRPFPPLTGGGPGAFPADPGYGVYRCADGGALALGIAHEDRFWAAFCGVVGLEHVGAVVHAERVARREELVSAVSA